MRATPISDTSLSRNRRNSKHTGSLHYVKLGIATISRPTSSPSKSSYEDSSRHSPSWAEMASLKP